MMPWSFTSNLTIKTSRFIKWRLTPIWRRTWEDIKMTFSKSKTHSTSWIFKYRIYQWSITWVFRRHQVFLLKATFWIALVCPLFTIFILWKKCQSKKTFFEDAVPKKFCSLFKYFCLTFRWLSVKYSFEMYVH